MHSFMKSIGFSKKQSQMELETLIKDVVSRADTNRSLIRNNGRVFVEYQKCFAENIGVVVRGEEDDKGVFHIGNYYPFLKSSLKGLDEGEIFIHKKVDSDAYTGMTDDIHLGVSLIFYLHNIVDFMEKGDKVIVNDKKIKLSSLALNGKVILPTQKRIYAHIANKIDNAVKNQLLDDAKNGNTEALDYLAMNEMNNNALLNERIKHEDLFSIVETTFIPYGSESDLYTVLANITAARQLRNEETGELLWKLNLVCNDIPFETLINVEDLLGFPTPGMRFKGVIWMQGEVVL
ncbi:MAG: DUF3881 family protein [Lachnospiraceae bacterium]|nr:DUF3881 family protein [Lachnospiraceae bacterium]